MKILWQSSFFIVIKVLLFKAFSYVILSFNGRVFSVLFNFSLWLNSKEKEKIFYKNGFYCFKNKEWKFFHRKQAFHAYWAGLEKRKNKLKKAYLIEQLTFETNDVIIDCGANNGDFYLIFDLPIKYYGFEPSPSVFLALQDNVKGQFACNQALWKQSEKEIKFFLDDAYGNSSIIPIANYDEIVKIQTITLDQVIDQIGESVKLIKIEAEGSEPEVLEGLKRNLNKVQYITVDAGFERGIEQQSTIIECCNYLIKNHFSMIGFNENRHVILFKNESFQS